MRHNFAVIAFSSVCGGWLQPVGGVKLLALLDAHGMNDPDNREGHPEDRCNVCEWPIVDHLPTYSRISPPAKWPHRRAAAAELIGQWINRQRARWSQ